MATLGYTKLEAVNMMLFGVNQPRVTALDTSGTSDAAEAEYVLDIVTRRVLSRGWPTNIEKNQTATAADVGSGVYKVTLPSDVLAVRGAGANASREFSIRAGFLFDQALGTDDFESALSFTLDYLVDLDFADIDPRIKELIVAEATLEYTSRKMPQKDVLEMLSNESLRADILAPRSRPDETLHLNTAPFIPPKRQRDDQR